jgi:hypothetical protein
MTYKYGMSQSMAFRCKTLTSSLCEILHLRSTVGCQMSTLYCGGGSSRNIYYIQCVECAFTVIYLLLVARNLYKYILLLFIFLILRHIALLVASLVVASLSLWDEHVIL